jgi:hypothetical protein
VAATIHNINLQELIQLLLELEKTGTNRVDITVDDVQPLVSFVPVNDPDEPIKKKKKKPKPRKDSLDNLNELQP